MDAKHLPPGLRVRAERLNRGLGPNELAAELGLSVGTVRNAEKGDGLYPSSAKKIADYFGLKVTDIWPVEEPSS